MPMQYTGRVFELSEFNVLAFDISCSPIGTLSDALLRETDEWILVTPHGDRWAEIVEVCDG